MEKLSEDHQYLLLGKITDSLSQEEKKELELLLAGDENVRSAYESLVNELPAHEKDNHFAFYKSDTAWKQITHSSLEKKPFRIPSYTRWIAVAAITALLIGSGMLWNNWFNSQKDMDLRAAADKSRQIRLTLADGKKIDLAADNKMIRTGAIQLKNVNKTLSFSMEKTSGEDNNQASLEVPMGMDYKINLDDGSEVWLNSASKMDFPFHFSQTTREISIYGEAYIRVAPDVQKPFIVHLPGNRVEVLGTEFNVNTYDSGIARIALVKGSVHIHTDSSTRALLPGQEALSVEGKTMLIRSMNEKLVLSWRKGLFYFDETPLSEINKVLPRWFGIQTVIDNPALSTKRFTGVLNKNQPLDVFMDDLKAISGIETYLDQNKVLHFR